MGMNLENILNYSKIYSADVRVSCGMKSTSFVIDYVVINIHHGSFKKFPLQVIVFYFVSWTN